MSKTEVFQQASDHLKIVYFYIVIRKIMQQKKNIEQ